MFKFVHYVGQFQSARGNLNALPAWSKPLLFLAAIPGLILVALSILLFGVSILALLLLTVPTYKIVRLWGGTEQTPPDEVAEPVDAPRRHIDVTIVE
jgi:hypothetical protein